MADDVLYCVPDDAERLWGWLQTRGGIAVWESVNLANPAATWSTPARTEDGAPTPKPTWQAGETPVRIVTDPARVLVTPYEEVRRFRVAVRQSSNGLSLKVSDGGSRRIRSAVRRAAEKSGRAAWNRFDYDTQEAVILVETDAVQIDEWVRRVNERKRGGNGTAA